MKVATWNINGTKARLDFLMHWLAARSPDVVGLQELKMADDSFPHLALEAAGYKVVTHGQKSWNGVAILSREPAEVTQRGLPGQDEMGARLITAEVSGLRFTTVYVPNGKTLEHEDYGRKLAWLDALAEHLEAEKLRDSPAILCGDFNICPGPLDSWDEERLAGGIFHTDAERARYARILDAAGMTDAYRQLYPDRQEFSWWDYRGGAFHRKLGLRIDLMLATESAMARIDKVEIDRDYRKKQDGLTPSDHAPVLAELSS